MTARRRQLSPKAITCRSGVAGKLASSQQYIGGSVLAYIAHSRTLRNQLAIHDELDVSGGACRKGCRRGLSFGSIVKSY